MEGLWWDAAKGGDHAVLMIVAALAVALLLASIVAKSWKLSATRDAQKFPKGPPAWPILGHLPALLTGKPTHQTLAVLACGKHGYGSIMGLRLGCRPTIVLSGKEAAKAVLLTHDKIFANRPHFRLADELFFGFNNAVILSSYTPRLVWLRKVYTQELFTAKRLQQLQHIRQDEVRRLLAGLLQDSGGGREAVDVRKLVAEMTANATARLLHSSTLAETALDLPELINSKLDTVGVPTIGDFIPWLRFLDVLQVRRMRAVHRRYDEIMDSIISKRRQLMRNTPSDELPHDFLQVVLSKETAEDPHERLSVQEVKGIIADILAGGIHTSAATIEWGMTQLLRKRACMQKLQEEVDGVMKGKEGQQVTDEAAATMPYLEKVVKEILRLHPVVPMLPPRMSNQDCKVGEYSIPKGTQAIVNAWAIARDPALWGDTAQEFMPERFDEKQVELSAGQHFELLAFGSGRRICPGLRLGLSIVHVTIANLVHAYNWSAPPSALLAASSLDLSENPSTLTNTKATPLLAIPTPRHPPPSLFSLSAA